jgi:hypothetical protein
VFKLLFGLPLLGFGLVFAAAMLPLGIAALVVMFVIGALAFALRLTGAILAGVGTLLCGVFGLVMIAFMLALGFAVLGAMAHLLVPILFVLGLVWLIRALSRPTPRPLGHF